MVSMTGYAYVENENENFQFTLEIRSVNSRFLDIYTKIPYWLNPYENDIRTIIKKGAKRGKVDVTLTVQEKARDYNISLDFALARRYYEAFQKVVGEFDLNDDVRLGHFIGSDGVFLIEDKRDKEKIWNDIKPYIHSAVDSLLLSKQREGEETRQNVSSILTLMSDYVEAIKKELPMIITEYQAKLKLKIQELVDDEKFDEGRVLQEVGILAVKADINEEIQRLETHIKLCTKNCQSDDTVGREMDFISQEMNREINTIGSKITNPAISQVVISLKTELEKFKEQIRNIE